MCQLKSALILKDKVICPLDHDDHTQMIKDAKLDDTTRNPNFVRVEIVPKDDNIFNHNLDNWQLKVDQDFRPKWFDEKLAEAEMKEVIQKVWRERFIIDKKLAEIKEGRWFIGNGGTVQQVWNGGTVQEVYGGTVQKVWNGGTVQQVWNGGTVQQVWNGGTVQEVWNGGTVQKVYGGTVQKVWNGGTVQEVYGGTVQEVYGGTVQKVWNGGTVQKVWNGGTVQKVYGGTVQKVYGGTVQKVYGGTVQEVLGGIVQIYNGKYEQIKDRGIVILRSEDKIVVANPKIKLVKFKK